MKTDPTICIVPEYPLSLMPGGLQVQAVECCQALRALGVRTELLSWSAPTPPADLYHFFGFPRHVAPLAALVGRAGHPYVCSVLCGAENRPGVLIAAALRHAIKRHLLSEGRIYHQALRSAAAWIVANPAERQVLRRVFGLPADRITVVPHGVDEGFWSPAAEVWHDKYGTAPFVLSVGAIQRRKRQLLLVEACNHARLPLVLLGPVLPGEEDYARHVAKAMETNTPLGGRWLTNLTHADPLFRSAFGACRLFVLLSSEETQPVSVLEAMAAGRPVLLAEAAYVQEPPFTDVPHTRAHTPDELASELRWQWEHGMPSALPREFAWPAVAKALQNIYERVLAAAVQ